MPELDISPHAMEQFQSRWWLKTGGLIPWSEIGKTIEELLGRAKVFSARGEGVVEYRVEGWAFVVNQKVARMITAKLRPDFNWDCPRKRLATVYIYNDKGKRRSVTHLSWGAVNSTHVFEFNPLVSLREILYALRSFGCRIARDSDWTEVWGDDWVAIPVYLPAQSLSLDVVRQLKGELAVVPTKKKHGRDAIVVSDMGGQYRSFQDFVAKHC